MCFFPLLHHARQGVRPVSYEGSRLTKEKYTKYWLKRPICPLDYSWEKDERMQEPITIRTIADLLSISALVSCPSAKPPTGSKPPSSHSTKSKSNKEVKPLEQHQEVKPLEQHQEVKPLEQHEVKPLERYDTKKLQGDWKVPRVFASLFVGKGLAFDKFRREPNDCSVSTAWTEVPMMNAHAMFYEKMLAGLYAMGGGMGDCTVLVDRISQMTGRTDIAVEFKHKNFIWEMKRPDSGLHSFWDKYPWGDPNPLTEELAQNATDILGQARPCSSPSTRDGDLDCRSSSTFRQTSESPTTWVSSRPLPCSFTSSHALQAVMASLSRTIRLTNHMVSASFLVFDCPSHDSKTTTREGP